MTYQQLEKIKQEWNKEVCLFGAGLIGKTWGYDIVRAAGFGIDFYCDNHVTENTRIFDEIKIIDFNTLCQKKDNVLIFITLSEKFQDEVENQFRNEGIQNYIVLGFRFLQEFCESVLESRKSNIFEKYKIVVDDESFLKRQFFYRCGYELNLNNPKTFNEKIQWLKLHDRKIQYVDLVDKYELKKYIEQEIGTEYVIPTIGVWDKVENIEWDKLPNRFVLKCTHDSGSVIICTDKNNFDFGKASEKLKRALKRNYFWYGREWPYKNVRPSIIAEQLMEDKENKEIIDYKFLCFNGKFECMFTCTERFCQNELKVTFFDRNWNRLPFERHYPSSRAIIKKPINYDKMIEISEKLAGNIPLVRVDLYEINKKIYVGELTLYPGGGFEEFSDYEYDLKLGTLVRLN